MGKQCRFILTKNDEAKLLKAISVRGDFVMLRRSAKDEKHKRMESLPALAKSPTGGSNFALVRSHDVDAVSYTHARTGTYILGVDESPAIEFTRSWLNDGKMMNGRMWFSESYWDASKNCEVKKNDDFIKWANSILRLVRSNLMRMKNGDGYIGEEASSVKVKKDA